MNAIVENMGKRVKDVELNLIKLDGRCQPRKEMDAGIISEYAECLRNGDQFPPVGLLWDGKVYWCFDGFHRVRAHQEAGLAVIKAEVEGGTLRDAMLRSVGVNSNHGLRRTNADKRKAVETLLRDEEWSKWSDREIARHCMVHHDTVSKVRFELSGEIRQIDQRLVTRNGTTYLQDVSNRVNREEVIRPVEIIGTDRFFNEARQDKEDFQLRQQEGTNRAVAYITLEQWKNLSASKKSEILNFADTDKTFNKQDNASIEWAQWSWNPVTGCKHDCPYCYARDIANRFYEQKFEPALLSGRFSAPHNTKVPQIAETDIAYKNVFTCSMADLFGRWVPNEWIEAVFSVVRQNKQWNFLFLTKFPQRLAEFDLPENAWMGTTVDLQARVKSAEKAFAKIKHGVKWLSVEPMLEPLKFERLDLFDWVVIGGASASLTTPAWVPPIDWIVDLHQQARLAGCKIYYKTNCGMSDDLRIKEFPWIESAKKQLPEVFNYLKGGH